MTEEQVLAELRLAYKAGRLSQKDLELTKDMAAKLKQWGSWTERQTAMMQGVLRRSSQQRVVMDLKRLHDLFDTAQENGKKYPALYFKANDVPFKLSRAGDQSATPGAINIASANGGYHNGTYFGKITLDGELRLTQAGETLTDLPRLLQAVAEDPLKQAEIYGLETDNCSFCNKELTDPVSVKLKYGPTCAKKWGLEHNKAAAAAK